MLCTVPIGFPYLQSVSNHQYLKKEDWWWSGKTSCVDKKTSAIGASTCHALGYLSFIPDSDTLIRRLPIFYYCEIFFFFILSSAAVIGHTSRQQQNVFESDSAGCLPHPSVELDGEATEMERGQGAMEKRNNYFTSSSSTKTAFLSADVVFLLDGLRCRALWPELGAKFFFPCCLYECVWLSSGS